MCLKIGRIMFTFTIRMFEKMELSSKQFSMLCPGDGVPYDDKTEYCRGTPHTAREVQKRYATCAGSRIDLTTHYCVKGGCTRYGPGTRD